jgi:hypothetical protein
MRIKHLSILLLLTASVFPGGCQTAATTAMNESPPSPPATLAVNATPVTTQANVAATPAADAPRISLADAKAAFDAGKALFVDSRADSAYKAEHIKGAINIPAGTLDAKLKELPKDKKIIVYCS